MKNLNFISLFCLITFASCQSKSPVFSGEKAFDYLIKQCDFGPRDPGSAGHKKTLEYYLSTFKNSLSAGIDFTTFTALDDVQQKSSSDLISAVVFT